MALTKALLQDGHAVRHMSRSRTPVAGVDVFTWDIPKGHIESAAVRGVDHVVHLSGAGIADKRWTRKRLAVLVESRADAARLLLRAFKEEGVRPLSFVSASGAGCYGAQRSDRIFREEDPIGTDTLGWICKEWEAAADEWGSITRVVKLRTPMVFSPEGGALPRLAAPARWGLAAALGSGDQWVPWIHVDDLVLAYRAALERTTMEGAYNVCADEQVNNRELMRAVARTLHRPFFLPPVPGILLRLVLGEMSALLLGGSRISGRKLREAGVRPGYDALVPSLEDCLKGS